MAPHGTSELLDLLAALRGRRSLTAEDLRRADEILDAARWCERCGGVIEDDNDDEYECFACQGAPGA